MNTIGSRISALRKERGFSQEYVAEKLDVSRQAVSKWEQDLCAPDTYNLIALAELFSVSVEYIAVGKAETKSEAPATAPAPKTITVQQILGLIFITVGLLAALISLMTDALLFLVGIYLIVLGLLCLAIRKRVGLTLCWLHWIVIGACFSIFGQNPFVMLGFTWASIITVFYWICLIPLLIFSFANVIKKMIDKLSKKSEK